MKYFGICFILIISSISYLVKSDSVCSAKMLINELVQDVIADGTLDCLLVPKDPPTDRIETSKEEKQRVEAAWDSDCAFTADYDWFSIAKKRYGIRTGLVDKDGKSLEGPINDQADICQLIRSMVFAGVFEGVNLQNMNEDSFDGIDCVGPANRPEYQICAATDAAASNKFGWLILLEPSSITMMENNVRPKWVIDTKSRELLEKRSDPGESFN